MDVHFDVPWIRSIDGYRGFIKEKYPQTTPLCSNAIFILNEFLLFFKPGGSKVSSGSENAINIVAKLLHVEAAGLKMALTTRLMSQVKQLGAAVSGDIK